MKTRIGELNGRPLVVCSDENIIRDSELLVITDATGKRIVDIKERIGEELKSIIDFPKLEKPEEPEEPPEDEGVDSKQIQNLINKLGL